MDYLYAMAYRKIIKGRIQNSTCYGNTIHSSKEGNEIIRRKLSDNSPCMIGRIGTIEMGALNAYLSVKLGMTKHLPVNYRNAMYNNTGLFPNTEETMFRWGECYLDAGKEVDIFATFGKHTEDYYIKHYTQTEQVVELRSLEPYYHENPWSIALEGKKVLVIHPFSKSIQKQYQKREHLFDCQDILPRFELFTIQAVQTVAGNTSGYSNWFEALEYMKKEIAGVQFDIAILGCGAYAFPLAAYIKQLGKKSIITAGATQIIFGIKGARWDNHPVISNLFNEYWIRPEKSEIPDGAKNVENGCYW